jgi:hypothetical protein
MQSFLGLWWKAPEQDDGGGCGMGLVGGNARTHAAPADGHAAIHLAASNRTGQGHNKSGWSSSGFGWLSPKSTTS